MDFIKKYKWHFIGWLMYLVFQHFDSNLSNIQLQLDYIGLNYTYVLSAMAVFYFLYILVWLPLFKSDQFVRLLLIPIGLLVFVFTRYFLEEIICPTFFGFDNYRYGLNKIYIFDNIPRTLLHVLTSFVAALLTNREINRRELQILNNEKSNAEMAFLRSQLNPHFLFNTLSFLYTKTMKLDPKLGDSVRQLSDVLRYSLESSKKEKVSLQKEIELVENYINIFKNRFEGEFHVNFNLLVSNPHVKIEPLLLMPFVENAFKHGIRSNPDDPIIIELQQKEKKVIFHIKNKINTHHKDPGSGIGIENIKRRLELLYPENYSLDIKSQNEYFVVDLEINI